MSACRCSVPVLRGRCASAATARSAGHVQVWVDGNVASYLEDREAQDVLRHLLRERTQLAAALEQRDYCEQRLAFAGLAAEDRGRTAQDYIKAHNDIARHENEIEMCLTPSDFLFYSSASCAVTPHGTRSTPHPCCTVSSHVDPVGGARLNLIPAPTVSWAGASGSASATAVAHIRSHSS